MFRLLRDLVEREQRGQASITTGRVSSYSSGKVNANLRGQSNDAEGCQVLKLQDVAHGDNGFFLHLDGMQAPVFWQAANVSTRSADPPTYYV